MSSRLRVVAALVASGLLLRGEYGWVHASVTPEEAASAGPGHPWQGFMPNVNPYSFAKQTDVPIVSFACRGELRVDLCLHHSSMNVSSNPALGGRWSHSYNLYLDVWEDLGTSRAALVHGNQRVELFRHDGSAWVNDDGYRNVLTPAGSGYEVLMATADGTPGSGRWAGLRLKFEPEGTTGRYRLFAVVDRTGLNEVRLAYDLAGRLARITDRNLRQLVLGYSPGTGRLDKITFRVGKWARIWTLAYNAAGDLVTLRYPAVTTDEGVQTYSTRFAYDAAGYITSITDRAGHRWRYGYDVDDPGVLVWQQWPGNTSVQRVRYSFLDNGNREVVDSEGVRIEYEYDALGRLTRSIDGGGFATEFAYADADYAWAPSAGMFADGSTTHWDYAPGGRLLSYSDAAGNTWNWEYDAQGRLVRALQPEVTDAWGVPEGYRRAVSYAYDALGRLAELRARTPAGGEALVASYAYDALGQVSAVTNALGATTTYSYDAFGNLTRRVSPAGRTLELLYESADATFGYTAPGAMIDGNGARFEATRDELSRLRRLTADSGSEMLFRYDAMNRLVRLENDPNVPVDWAYTPQGWLASESVGGGAPVQYTYLSNGSRSSMVETGPGRALLYVYDLRARPIALNDNGATSFYTYDPRGRLQTRTRPSGAWSKHSEDTVQLQSSVEHYDATGAPVASFASERQENGRVKSITELDGSVTRYQYDHMNRLVREQRTGIGAYDFRWQYDAAGNRIIEMRDGIIRQFSYDPDGLPQTLVEVGTGYAEQLEWDGAGRCVRWLRPGEPWDIMWNDWGRTRGMDRDLGSGSLPVERYMYDAMDRQVRREKFDPFGLSDVQFDSTYDGCFTIRDVTTDRFGAVSEGTASWLEGLNGYQRQDAATVVLDGITDTAGNLRGVLDGAGLLTHYQGLFNAMGATIQDSGDRPPFAAGADAACRSDIDSRLISCAAGKLYDPLFATTFDPRDTKPAAVFTAGIVTDVGEVFFRVSSAELNFQTDGPIICQALFQRLAPRSPQYGASINYAGDRLEIYFDPAYTVTQGGIMFGTTTAEQDSQGEGQFYRGGGIPSWADESKIGNDLYGEWSPMNRWVWYSYGRYCQEWGKSYKDNWRPNQGFGR